jgi:hypothetical protein
MVAFNGKYPYMVCRQYRTHCMLEQTHPPPAEGTVTLAEIDLEMGKLNVV